LAYRDDKPRFSFGIGLGFGGGGRSSTAVGVSASTSDFRTDERLHVIFEGGRVSVIERTKAAVEIAGLVAERARVSESLRNAGAFPPRDQDITNFRNPS